MRNADVFELAHREIDDQEAFTQVSAGRSRQRISVLCEMKRRIMFRPPDRKEQRIVTLCPKV